MLGNVLKRLFRGETAGEQSTPDIREQPAAPPDPRFRQADDLWKAGKGASAQGLLHEILVERPDEHDALCLLGAILLDQRRFDEAEQKYHQALRSVPESPDALMGLGRLFHEKGDLKDSYLYLRAALRRRPSDLDARSRLAYVLLALGNLGAAQEELETALRHDPSNYHVWNALGILAHERRLAHEALPCFRRAAELKPDFNAGRRNLGMTLRELGDVTAAEAPLREALELLPDDADLNYCLGMALHDLGRYDEALDYLQRAVTLQPDLLEALTALGHLFYRMGQPTAARGLFSRALAIDPQYPSANLGMGELQLALGEFDPGWAHYDYRLRGRPERYCDYPFPWWQGEALEGKTLLIWWEQGLGDIIMFASCLPEMIARAKHCVIETDPRLVKLFRRSFPDATVHGNVDARGHSWLDEVPAIDVQTAIGSLPGYLRRRWEDFPQHQGYLMADTNRTAHWRARLAAFGEGLKIGISWEGGVAKTGKLQRSMPLSEWLPLLKREDVHFVSLQYTECREELADLSERYGIHVHHWQEAIADYDETAALVSALDLVITVCTAVVHLTGALGKPAWVLAPLNPAWRYLQQGERMPWYPSVRLVRQTEQGRWDDVFMRVGHMLDEFREKEGPAAGLV